MWKAQLKKTPSDLSLVPKLISHLLRYSGLCTFPEPPSCLLVLISIGREVCVLGGPLRPGGPACSTGTTDGTQALSKGHPQSHRRRLRSLEMTARAALGCVTSLPLLTQHHPTPPPHFECCRDSHARPSPP